MSDLTDLALRPRTCDLSDRPPTDAFPVYHETQDATIAIAGTSATLTFTAPRDLLIYYLAVDARLATDGSLVAGASVSLEYCDTRLLKGADAGVFAFCCARRPIIPLGVKDNKDLTYTVTIPAQLAATDVSVSIVGVQGNGCCP